MRSAGEIVGMVGRSGSQSKMVASQGKSADVTSAKIRHARPIVCPAHLVLRIIIYYGVVLAPLYTYSRILRRYPTIRGWTSHVISRLFRLESMSMQIHNGTTRMPFLDICPLCFKVSLCNFQQAHNLAPIMDFWVSKRILKK
ncbi:unnamed protein product [Nesidiocoris tenuis]|uniref:Uncharacterized protein n=1 Tax=Nesidiocoris tenuis TaxID=355587 RepID=A0A6H5FUM4_9HEMI|nr:unnamed protein product [Nesidiocoris tenuis]